MTYAEQLRSDYAAVRARLFRPEFAVPDHQPRASHDIRAPDEECMMRGGKRERHSRQIKAHRNLLDIKWVEIANQVARKHGLPAACLKQKQRGNAIVSAARNELCYRLRHELAMSNAQIGRVLSRDPSSVSAAIAKWERENRL
jgi:hypothetical protein